MYTYKLGGMLITDELYHDDLEAVTFGRKDQNELMHYGIKGQRWGKRRFQNEDGSLTAAGRNRYDVGAPLTGTTAANMSKNLTYKTWNGNSNGYGGAGGGKSIPINKQTFAKSNQLINTGSKIGNAAKNVSGYNVKTNTYTTPSVRSSVVGSADAGKKAADNIFGRIGNWASNAAKDVGNAATNVYGGAKNLAVQAGNAVGNAVSSAYNDASKFVNQAGQDISRTAGNVGNAVSSAAKDVGNLAGQAANDVSSWFSDGSKEREKLGKTRRDDEMIGAISRDFVKKNYPDEYDQFVKDQDSAKQARAQAVDDYMNFSNNPVNTVSRALNLPNKKGNWAYAVPGNEQYLDKFDEKWIPKTENIADWFTGNNYSNAQDTRNGYANEWDAKADEIRSYNDPNLDRFVEDANRYASEQREYADALANMYNNAPRQKINSALDAAGNWIGDRAKDVGNFATNAANDVGRTVRNATRDVGDWVGDRAQDVGNAVTGAAKDVGNWAGQAANDAKNWVGDRAQDIGNTVGSAAKDVGNAVNGAAKDVANWGAGAVESGKNFFNNLFGGGNKEPEQPTLSDPNERIITENIIPEQRITEQRIPEQRITEQRIPEQRITDSNSSMSDKPSNVSDEFWREYTFNGGTRDQYDAEMQRMRNQNANRQKSSNDMSDKPSNVSDEFWREYTFNGGTRDSYDREMNARKNSQNNQNGSASRKEVVGAVDTSRPHHFTYDPASGQTIVVYDDEKRR